MAASRSGTIWLKGYPVTKEAPGKAGKTIFPGYLLHRASDGTVEPHPTAGGAIGAPLVAFENEVFGKDINTAYDIGTQILFVAAKSGDEAMMVLAAAATAVVVGDFLESAGDGTIRKFGTGVIIGVALEAVDNSAGATPHFLNVEFN